MSPDLFCLGRTPVLIGRRSPCAPSSRSKKNDRPLPQAPAGAAPAEQFDMVFHCQLAHGSPTRQVRDFTNVKQLYESIAKAFGIATNDVRTCTDPVEGVCLGCAERSVAPPFYFLYTK